MQNDICVSDHENGLDIENDDDYVDHDPNVRPNKIRR